MRLLVARPLHEHGGQSDENRPVAYEYRVVSVEEKHDYSGVRLREPKVVLPADEKVVAVLP